MLHRIVGGAGLNIAVAPTAVASYFSHAVVVTTLLAGQHSADLLMPQPRRAQHGYCWAFPMDLGQIGYIVQISHGSLNSNVLFAQFGVFGRSRLTVVEFLLHAEQLHFECVQEEVVGLFPIHFLTLNIAGNRPGAGAEAHFFLLARHRAGPSHCLCQLVAGVGTAGIFPRDSLSHLRAAKQCKRPCAS